MAAPKKKASTKAPAKAKDAPRFGALEWNDETKQKVELCGRLQLNVAETAGYLGVTTAQLVNFRKKHADFDFIRNHARCTGIMLVNKTLMTKAIGGNVKAAMFVAERYGSARLTLQNINLDIDSETISDKKDMKDLDTQESADFYRALCQDLNQLFDPNDTPEVLADDGDVS